MSLDVKVKLNDESWTVTNVEVTGTETEFNPNPQIHTGMWGSAIDLYGGEMELVILIAMGDEFQIQVVLLEVMMVPMRTSFKMVETLEEIEPAVNWCIAQVLRRHPHRAEQ